MKPTIALVLALTFAGELLAQAGQRAQWIWSKDDAAGTRYFRKVFEINRPVEQPVDEGILDITVAPGSYTVWVNGTLVGSEAKDWKRVRAFDVRKLLVHGKNVIAVKAEANASPAGLLVRLGYVPNGLSKLAVVSDESWKVNKTADKGWQEVGYDDRAWAAARSLGAYGQVVAWNNLTWDQGGDDRFSVPPGFRVDEIVKRPAFDGKFSLVNLTFDNKGRLLVSRESGRGSGIRKGPVYLCTDPDKNGVLQTVKPYCLQVTDCQGMCWIKDALYLVGDGPQGTGLYRCRDTKGKDRIDEVTLLHKFPLVKVPGYHVSGGMGEHGPHAIIHGPDDWVYLVVGNHAWIDIGPKKAPNPQKLAANSPLRRWPTGGMGPDQGKAGTTEDVLLPRLNDGRGHASNILAPGGTIWRMDHNGQNVSLVAAGFRNQFDAAFSPYGELFTFDSDMEWDEALPWYRPVRVCHCPPGADFVWRTGAANTPDYYIDSLPPVAETGRGSPVGVECYDHVAFPEKYRGAFFMADWAIGVIFAVFPERKGASYKAKVEKFCTGAPMNVTDLVVAPDGSLYFTMGGRGSAGGVYRISYADKTKPTPGYDHAIETLQPLAAGSRAFQAHSARLRENDKTLPERERDVREVLAIRARGMEASIKPIDRIKSLDFLHRQLLGPGKEKLTKQVTLELANDKNSEVRAHAIWHIGVRDYPEAGNILSKALKDSDPLVRRRACEALIRANIEPPVANVWPLLGDGDRFVRHAARLVIERIEPEKWASHIWKEQNELIAWNGIIALCHINKAQPYAEQIFGRLRGAIDPKARDGQALLDYLRTVQMAMVHIEARPAWVRSLAIQCEKLFPQKDWRANRELAILLTQFQREGMHAKPIQAKLLAAIQASKNDRQQQIHYAYCLRLLKDGWTAKEKATIAAWYDGTQNWKGGHSFGPFLENIFKDTLVAFNLDDKRKLIEAGDKAPLPALVALRGLPEDDAARMLPMLSGLYARIPLEVKTPRMIELRQGLEEVVVRDALKKPTAANWNLFVRGLTSKNPLIRGESLLALRKLDQVKPKAEDPVPYRALILATPELGSPKEKWRAIELLRQWTGRGFGSEPEHWDKELKNWARWYVQAFPKEPALPLAELTNIGESKYKMSELLVYLDKHIGDVTRGRMVFEKANCLKCHKFGKEGEGVGPDLTAVSKRFKRADILEAILYPSKAISDQYRSVTIMTKSGQLLTGLAAVQGDTVNLVLADATKVTLKRDQIDTQVASLVSVMPERGLDALTKDEIADLFAYLESEPK